MKGIYGFLIVAMALTACSSRESKSSLDLVGKTIEYRYGERVYHVTFDSDTILHWEAMAGDEIGVKENETYVAEWIDSKKLFISWGETNGIVVSQILDFEKGKVHNHLVRNREPSMGEGQIRILD
ncbi:MoaF C-terminal domain-containing protein [Algoriphagus aquimarinus]|uniref:MoaF-related domain-containing protein n=1 Tax=Algoriphagus aquimarinus TaxID=237018 RepID=UPI0030DBAB37|tara:strand:- start:3434 stop:3808 length:375 start_codon:yes stop_codon:yes gene_type:complete